MPDFTLTSAPVTWSLANQIDGATAAGANGYVEFEASAVAFFHGGMTVLPSPQRAEVVNGVMAAKPLPVNDPAIWNWKVTPKVGVHWEPFHIDVKEGGTDLSSAAIVPGRGPVRVLRGPQGGSVLDAEDQGDGTVRFILDDGTLTKPVPFTRGPAGPANAIEIGTVLRGDEPYASLVGEAPNQVLNLILPKGDPGDPEDLIDATPEQRGLMSADDKAHLDETPVRDEVVQKASSKIIAGRAAAEDWDPDYDIGDGGTVVALGDEAMQRMQEVKKSIAIGRRALGAGVRSRDNVAIGEYALFRTSADSADYDQSQQGGTRNVAVGGNAGLFVENGVGHVTIGRNAGQNVVGGRGLVAIGNNSHASQCPVGLSGEIENWAGVTRSPTADLQIAALGGWALSRNISVDNTAVGYSALRQATVSHHNVAVGSNALRRLDDASWLNGHTWTQLDMTGTYTWDGLELVISGVAGHGVVAGDIVTIQLLDGAAQTFQTDQPPATVNRVTGTAVILDVPVAKTATGAAVLVGVAHQASAPESNFNTAVGADSLAHMTTGEDNVTMGLAAGYGVTSGARNVAVGTRALVGGTVGTSTVENTAVGYQALYSLATGGDYNVAMGWRAGFNLAVARQNTILGYGAGRQMPSGAALTTVVNSTAIGNNARLSGSNEVQLGNSDTTTYVYGTVQNRSDLRDKADVRDTALGLDFVNALRPVDFRWDMREDYEDGARDGSKKRTRFHHGVIAQEVRDACEAAGVEFGGLQDHALNGGDDVLSIGYDELIGPLIKAVQELSARLRDLEA